MGKWQDLCIYCIMYIQYRNIKHYLYNKFTIYTNFCTNTTYIRSMYNIYTIHVQYISMKNIFMYAQSVNFVLCFTECVHYKECTLYM